MVRIAPAPIAADRHLVLMVTTTGRRMDDLAIMVAVMAPVAAIGVGIRRKGQEKERRNGRRNIFHEIIP